jgi:ketosteroid isomerase-like protein
MTNESKQNLVVGTSRRNFLGTSIAGAAVAISSSIASAKGSDETPESVLVVTEFLSNTSPDKIEAAARRLVADDATYISLNFDNAELKRILPWTGTRKGRYAYVNTFVEVSRYWTIEDFKVFDLFGAGENVAVFGSFTYRSKTRGKSFTSPFSVHAKVRDGKIIHFMFMEDTFASARSFSSAGTWTIKTDPNGSEYEV